ncbi:MAG: hypothetical protein ACRECN_07160 [Methylocella sp.]
MPGFAKEAWNGCFRRVYDAAHLAAHPGQTVKSIAVLMKPITGRPSNIDRWWYNKPWIANAKLIITLRGKKSKYYGYNAYCVATAAGLECPMEEDAGDFTLALWGAGVKLVVSKDQDLRLARAGQISDESNVFVRGNTSEDRTFLLPPAPAAACK